MWRLLVFILVCLMLVPVTAQADLWESSCDDDAQTVIAPIIGEALYAAGCDALDACIVETVRAPVGCEYPVYEALMRLCDGEDCGLQSRFYMASLLMFEDPTTALYAYLPRDVQAIFPETLLAFQARDYHAVIDDYEAAQAELEPPFQGFIIGLMYEALGDPERAADAYRTSIEMHRFPFVTEQRACVLSELGFADSAAAETLVIGDHPSLQGALSAYPLSDALTEPYTAYPVSRRYGGEYGSTDEDDSMLAGIPFEIAFLSDGSILMLGATETIQVYASEPMPEAILFYPDAEDDRYIHNEGWAASYVTLTWNDAIGTMVSVRLGIMADSEARVMIAPEDALDPRETQNARCADGARWRLRIEGYGATNGIFGEDATPYFDAPSGALAGRFNADLDTFRVVDGPVCIESQAWWEIDLVPSDGHTYWLPEARAQSQDEPTGLFYLVFPRNPPSD